VRDACAGDAGNLGLGLTTDGLTVVRGRRGLGALHGWAVCARREARAILLVHADDVIGSAPASNRHHGAVGVGRAALIEGLGMLRLATRELGTL